MKKSALAVLALLALVVALTAFLRLEITGNDILEQQKNVASIRMNILPYQFIVEIISPENKTYSENRIITRTNLNVSSNYEANMSYKLTRICDGSERDVLFAQGKSSVNTTIDIYQRGNKLDVFGDYGGAKANDSVVFSVMSRNMAPEIFNLTDTLYVCENNQILLRFGIRDFNEDNLAVGLEDSGQWPFSSYRINSLCNLTNAEIISAYISKQIAESGPYERTIYASDDFNLAEATIKIVTIPVNNPPLIESIGENTSQVNTTFYQQVYANDIEEGNSSDGNLDFNLTLYNSSKSAISKFFDINNLGEINFTANSSNIGIYFVKTCVTDKGLDVLHPNASLCNENGDKKYNCTEFKLIITDSNKKPNITDYNNDRTGKDLSLTMLETESTKFNVTAYDANGAPGVYWYVDNIEKGYKQGSGTSNYTLSEFIYTPLIGDAGNHNITAVATDGLLSDFVQWNVTVLPKPAPPSSGGGGGGGGGGIAGCKDDWVCSWWSECQMADYSRRLDQATYNKLKQNCELLNLNPCGVQIRTCQEINKCNSTRNKPAEVQECLYTENPSCFDSIKNCHDNSCELLIDCGGPCRDCPTCSDGIRNQQEEGVDCGGPCKACSEKPRRITGNMIYLLSAVALVIAIVTILSLIKMIQTRYKYKKVRGQENG